MRDVHPMLSALEQIGGFTPFGDRDARLVELAEAVGLVTVDRVRRTVCITPAGLDRVRWWRSRLPVLPFGGMQMWAIHGTPPGGGRVFCPR